MAKRKGEEKEVFYVGLNNPIEMRRDILEAMKDSILILKTHDHIRKRRAQKAVRILNLKELIGEIDVLLNRLKRRLPKTRLRTSMAELSSKKQAVKAKKPSEIQQLEAELGAIEDKLGSL